MAQVVTAQPGTTVVVQQTQVLRDWNSGVFACLDDIGSCKLIIFLISFLSYLYVYLYLEALLGRLILNFTLEWFYKTNEIVVFFGANLVPECYLAGKAPWGRGLSIRLSRKVPHASFSSRILRQNDVVPFCCLRQNFTSCVERQNDVDFVWFSFVALVQASWVGAALAACCATSPAAVVKGSSMVAVALRSLHSPLGPR